MIGKTMGGNTFAGAACRRFVLSKPRHMKKLRAFQRSFSTQQQPQRSKLKKFRVFFTGTSVALVGGSVWIAHSAPKELATLPDDGLPLTYDVEVINSFWNQHPKIVVWRLGTILGKVFPFLAKTYVQSKFGALQDEASVVQKASEFREILTNLGPAFIKLGQMLSTRPDLLPQAVLFELQKLCDAVPSFPTKQAIEIIQKELGQDAVERFVGLDENTKPIAAASLGQVYCLRMKKTGLKVAVKVQRPDMIRTVSLDLYLLRKYGQVVEAVKSVMMSTGILSPRKQFDVEFLDCFAKGSYLELDYSHEGENQESFRTRLVPMLNGRIRIPFVLWDSTSRKVLTSEWIEGKQLVQCPPATIQKLVPVGVECFLKQLLEFGFFHSDPHPGNLLVDEQERLCLIDFGLCAVVPLPDTKHMTEAIVHLMDGDVSSLLEDAINLGFLPPDVSRPNLLSALERVFRESKLSQDALAGLGSYHAIESRRKKFKDVSKELNSIFYEYPFLVPDYFALITRALIVLEGIAVVGDPAFDIFQAAYPYARKRSFDMFRVNDLWRIHSAVKSREGKSSAESSRDSSGSSWWMRIFPISQ